MDLFNPKTQNPQVSFVFCRRGFWFSLYKIFKGIIFCVLGYLKLGNEVVTFKVLENLPQGDSAMEKHLLLLGFCGRVHVRAWASDVCHPLYECLNKMMAFSQNSLKFDL